MRGALRAAAAGAALWAACSACSAIAGFGDFHRDCPEGLTLAVQKGVPGCVAEAGAGASSAGGKSTSGVAGSGGATHAGGAGAADAGETPEAGGAVPMREAGAGGGAGGRGPGGSAGTAGISGGGAGGTTVASACSLGSGGRFHGPAMTEVSRMDGTRFLIDRTEVTFGDYDAFLAAHVPPLSDPACKGAGEPLDADCAALLSQADAGSVDASLPQVCVDWCAAQAYCQWAGKELCPDTASGADDMQAKSDFYLACSLDGSRYGCGDGCVATDCNGADSQTGRAAEVGTKPTCAVGPDACPIYDLSGNAEEWTSACTVTTADGMCIIRGGSFESSETDLRCDTRKPAARRKKFVTVGFRCCVDPAPG